MSNSEKDARSEAASLLGKKGGEMRAKKLTAAQRKKIAKTAAQARWGKGKA